MFASRWLIHRIRISIGQKLFSRSQVPNNLRVPAVSRCMPCIRGLADSSSLQTNAIILKEKITELRKCVIKSGKLSSLQMLDAILHQIDKGDTVSSGDALFLISSCASADNATPGERMRYSERVINLLEVKHSLSTIHYNLMLKLSLSDPNQFDVRRLIDKWNQNNISPNDHTAILLQRLLNRHLSSGNAIECDLILRKLMKLRKKLSELERCASQIIGLYLRANNMLAAMELYSEIQTKSTTFTLNQSMGIVLIQFLFDNDRVNDALELAKHIRKEQTSKNLNTKWKSVLIVAEQRCTENELEELYATLLSKNVILANGSVLAPLIHRYLEAGNLEKAVQSFYNFSGTYRVTPCLNKLLIKLIENKEVEHLERVVTIALELYGKSSLYDLACAFIECNRVIEAKNIFEKLPRVSQSPVLQQKADYFYAIGKDECLMGLLDAVGDHVHVDDQNYIREKLLMARCRRSDPPDEILSSCDEFESKPSAECLKNLEYYLKTHNRSLPSKWTEQVQPRAIAEEVGDKSQLYKSVDGDNKRDETKETIFEALESDGEIRIERKKLRNFLSMSQKNGDIDTFEKLRSRLDEHTKQHLLFSKYDCRLHIAVNRCREYLMLLKQEAIAANTNTKRMNLSRIFPQEAYEILVANPDLSDTFEDMAIVYAAKNVLKPMCVLWLHHFSCNNVDECRRLHENYQLSDAILCKLGAHLFLKSKDVGRLKALSEALDKSKIPTKVLAKLYECLLETLLHHNHHDQIANTLTDALEFISLSYIRQQTLDKIRFGGKDLGDAQTILMSKLRK